MSKRTPFPPVFWVANTVEILERFAYYGIYMGFGIYMTSLGYSRAQLGVVQSIFLLFSYVVPVISGTFADRYGFKKVLLVSYLAYLPSILLLILTQSFSGIALTMMSIGLAAGIFKPLISGTVRVTTDKTNKTLGFGIFYAMVNVGASFGPIVAGRLRAISWKWAFFAAALGIILMFFITLLFYKEPPRELQGITLKQKFRDLGVALADVKFAIFLILLGFFFWLPFWSFFNLLAVYIDGNLDIAQLYLHIKSVLGSVIANFLSREENGSRVLIGEMVAHTGFIIMVFQIFVSRMAEKVKAMPAFFTGLFVSAVGFGFLGYANVGSTAWVFLGILFFAVGEMISSPRIQEYITWIAPKEKAGLYMGSNFLAIGLGGALSGLTYTTLYGIYGRIGHPEYVWFTMAIHTLIGIPVLWLFTKFSGGFTELEE